MYFLPSDIFCSSFRRCFVLFFCVCVCWPGNTVLSYSWLVNWRAETGIFSFCHEADILNIKFIRLMALIPSISTIYFHCPIIWVKCNDMLDRNNRWFRWLHTYWLVVWESNNIGCQGVALCDCSNFLSFRVLKYETGKRKIGWDVL